MTSFFDSMTDHLRDERCRDRLAARVAGGLGLVSMNVLAAWANDFSRAGRRAAARRAGAGAGRCRGEGRVTINSVPEVSIGEALSDPIVRTLMAADRVDPAELEASLDELATKLARRSGDRVTQAS